MADVNNKIDVRGDGSVVLYQRGNRDGSINEIFQMRIRVPLTASKGYFRGSTGESKRLALRVHYDANNRDLFFGSGTIF